MSEDEIRKIVDEAVAARVGQIVAQMGRELEEHYVRRDRVEEIVDRRIEIAAEGVSENLSEEFKRQVEAVGSAVEDGQEIPGGLVGEMASMFVSIMLEISAVREQVISHGLWLMADDVLRKGLHLEGTDTMGRSMNLAKIKEMTLAKERALLEESFEKAVKAHPEIEKIGRDFLDLFTEDPSRKSSDAN